MARRHDHDWGARTGSTSTITERIVPHTYATSRSSSQQMPFANRHGATPSMGILRPSAAPEIWSYTILMYSKRDAIEELVKRGQITRRGGRRQGTPRQSSLRSSTGRRSNRESDSSLRSINSWDRKMIAHLFGYDYSWEIYTPLAKRRWGYYLARIIRRRARRPSEFWNRNPRITGVAFRGDAAWKSLLASFGEGP